MKKTQAALLILANGGMELSWRYAWASFLMVSFAHQPFPLPEAIGTFVLAAAIDRVLRGRGLRVISILGLHIIGFLLAASRIIYSFNYRAYLYFDTGWLLAFLSRTRNSLEWLVLVTLLIFAVLFWLAGMALARRSSAYLFICVRFDYGVAAFFCLFILKSLLLVKWGVDVSDPAGVFLLLSFFIFSLLAVGLARNSDDARRHFLADYKAVGILIGFAVVVLVFGAGLVLLFMPYMSAGAEAGYGVLKSATGPLIPILERVLLFLFGKSGQHEPASPMIEPGELKYIPSDESSWWSEPVLKILGGGILGLMLLVGLILCALGIWYLLRWLFSRTSKKTPGRRFKWALPRIRGYRDAMQLYRALLNWGRRSGRPHLLRETPAEYGLRLQKQFPSLTRDIGRIVEAFNLVVYGEVALDDEQMTRAKVSWRRLRSARYWPARLKSCFLHEDG